MKDKTIALCITVGILVGLVLGCIIGGTANNVHGYTAKFWYDSFINERQIRIAQDDLLHRWYSNDDNDYWFDVVMKTKEYQRLDSILDGDWEDFYYYETPLLWDGITYDTDYVY